MNQASTGYRPILVYRASAGSGKTFTLVAHYLACILGTNDPAAFGHVLAVTFTNKATAEMKSRILETLYGLAHGLPESDSSLQAVALINGASAATLRKRAATALTAILHAYHRFAIATIDAFQKDVVQGVAMELGLPAGFQVDVDTGQAVHDAVVELFLHLKDGSRELNWIIDSINERLDEDRRWDMRREVEDFARNNLFSERVMLEENAINQAVEHINTYTRSLQKLRAKVQKQLPELAEQWTQELVNLGVKNEDFSRGGSMFGTYFKRIRGLDATPPSDTLKQRAGSTDKWLAKTKHHTPAAEQAVAPLQALLSSIEKQRAKWFCQLNSVTLTLQHLSSLCLLSSVDRIIRQQREERSRFMLARIPMLIHQLSGQDDASFIFEKAGTRFDHILMDECQDTSQVQWDNFCQLLLQTAAAGQTNLLVGDVKQSIYRWRGSNYRLLQDVEATFPNRVQTKTLDTNYRSADVVVAFNNSFFDLLPKVLQHDLPELKTLYTDVKQKTPGQKARGYVEVTLFAKDEELSVEERTLDKMAQKILQLHGQGLAYNQMIVLARTNWQLQKFIDYCAVRQLELPLVSDEAFQLNASAAVQALVAALRTLIEPQNRVAPATVAYEYLKYKQGRAASLPHATRHPDRVLPVDLAARREQLLAMPLVELVEWLILKLELAQWPGQAAYVHAFIDAVMAFAADHAASAAELVEEWDAHMQQTKIPVTGNDGVRLLTIHKAKGLEAHTVFIPFCDWPLNSRHYDETFWCHPTVEPYSDMPLVPISKKALAEQSIYAQDYTAERRDECLESVNLLYVAFTRAKENLFVYAPLVADGKGLTTAHLIKAVLTHNVTGTIDKTQDYHYTRGRVVTPQADGGKNKKTASANPLKQGAETCEQGLNIYESSLEFKQSNESREFTQSESEDDERGRYIKRGNLLHKLFSSIVTQADAEAAFTAAPSALMDADVVAEGRRLFAAGMQNALVASWFAPGWQVRCECSLLLPGTTPSQAATERRPDRVLIDSAGRAVVIDFKFAAPREAHRRQVAEYKDLLASMGYADVEGYLWYVYPNKVERV